MNAILVVNVNWVGDVIFSTPVFKALKAAYPQARIACLAVPRVRAVAESCPYIDEFIEFDEKGTHWTPWGKWALVADLRRRKFDAAFLLHRAWTRALLVCLAGIPVRVGYDTKNRGALLTRRIPWPEDWMHRSDQYLRVIEAFGVPVSDRSCALAVDETARRDIADMLAASGINEGKEFIIVNTGGNWDLKRWPRENFAGLIRGLSGKGWNVVIPGAVQDIALAEEIGRLSGAAPVILAGKTDLKQLLALMERARLLISNDSGPIHLAAAVGTPVVGIFGPTRPEVTAPRGKGPAVILQRDTGCNRAPCYYLDCPDNICMKAVSVEEVLGAAERLLAEAQVKG